jgi:hypothetical protein
VAHPIVVGGWGQQKGTDKVLVVSYSLVSIAHILVSFGQDNRQTLDGEKSLFLAP